MRVVITGGTGLIGRALAESLMADGHEAIVLSRNPERARALPAGARVVRWDGRTAEGWAELADGADAIVNLAGENIGAGRWTGRRKHRIRNSRLAAGQAVVQAVAQARVKPRVVIQSSGVGYYGTGGDERITEESGPGNDWLAGLAREWEASTAPVEALGVRRAIIRTGVVLSRESGALPRMALPFRLFAGGPVGNGRQWLSWIHLADEVAAIRFLIEHQAAWGPFNLTAPNPVTNASFARVLGRVMARPAFVPVPAPAMRLLFGEMATLLLDGQRVEPACLQALGFRFRFAGLEAALSDLFRLRYEHRFRVPAPLADVAEFHRQASSLPAITPPPMRVRVHRAPERLGEGDALDFTLLLGPVPVRWMAHVENVTPTGFTDRQVRGPFRHWAHHHQFVPIDAATTEVVDRVEGALEPQLIRGAVGQAMWLGLPILFAYRGWKTRRLLAKERQAA